MHIGGQRSEAVKEERQKGRKMGMAMGLNGLLTLSSRSTGVLHSNTVAGLHSILSMSPNNRNWAAEQARVIEHTVIKSKRREQ